MSSRVSPQSTHSRKEASRSHPSFSSVAYLHFGRNRSPLVLLSRQTTNENRTNPNRSNQTTHSHSLALSRTLLSHWIHAKRSNRAVRFVCSCLPIHLVTSNLPSTMFACSDHGNGGFISFENSPPGESNNQVVYSIYCYILLSFSHQQAPSESIGIVRTSLS